MRLRGDRSNVSRHKWSLIMAEYELTCFDKSGNSYKPALMLELTQSDWQPRLVDYFHGETRSDDYRAFRLSLGVLKMPTPVPRP